MAKAYQNIWKWIYGSSAIAFVVGFIVNGFGYTQISSGLLVTSVALTLLAFICFEKGADLFTKAEYVVQLTISYLILSLFLILAALSPFTQKDSFVVLFAEIVGTLLPCFYLLLKYISRISPAEAFVRFFKEKYLLLFICTLFVLLSIGTLDDWLRLDSNTYYLYLQNAKQFDFTYDGISLLKLGGHQSYGVAFFYLMGEFLTPDSPAGARIVQILCICVSIFMLSSIIDHLKLDGGNAVVNALYCAVFAFAPQILGTIYSINLDTMLMCFWIWVIYFYAKQKRLLLLFSACLLVFSKENGIIVLFGFGVGVLINCLIDIRGSNITVKEAVRELWIPVAGGLLFLVTWFFGGARWFSSNNSFALASEENQFHKFGWSTVSVLTKFQQLYCLNFNWIITLSVLLYLAYKLFRCFGKRKKGSVKTRKADRDSVRVWCVILSSYFAFLMFNCVYITYGLPRYVAPGLYVLILIWAFVNRALINKWKVCCLSVTAVLMLVQSFITIDPVTLLLFRNVNMGSRTIISAIKYTMYDRKVAVDDSLLAGRAFGHTMEYNRQYSDFGDAFERFLKNIQYDDQTLVLIECIYQSPEFSSITMFAKEGVNDAVYYYDPKSGQISYDPQSDILNIYFISPEDRSWIERLPDYSDVYVVTFPYNPLYQEFSAVNDVDYIDQLSMIYRGWQIDARKLK